MSLLPYHDQITNFYYDLTYLRHETDWKIFEIPVSVGNKE